MPLCVLFYCGLAQSMSITPVTWSLWHDDWCGESLQTVVRRALRLTMCCVHQKCRLVLTLYIPGEHKKVAPCDFCWYFGCECKFLHEIYVTVRQSDRHFITKFGWNTLENDKIMLFQPRQPAFLSVRVSCRTDWMQTGSLRRLSGPHALQIWTHWTATSGTSCWKSIINSSWSIRQLMSWKLLCRPFRKRCHENTSTRQWQSSPSA